MNTLRTFLLAALIMVIFGVQNVEADASDDISVSNLYEPAGTPPPRANVEYEIIAEWSNEGDSDYWATVRLYSDCDQDDLADESNMIRMGAGESDTMTLEITFDETGEVCFSATVYNESADYGEFANYINVEPETGDADIWIELDMDGTMFAAGEDGDVGLE